MNLPSGLSAMLLMTLGPAKTRSIGGESELHRAIRLPWLLASVTPSELYERFPTGRPVPPERVERSRPLATSQVPIVPSVLPLAKLRPSGLKLRPLITVCCPIKTRFVIPVCTSHRRIRSPALTPARVAPSGLKAALEIVTPRSPEHVESSPPDPV